MFSIWGSPFPYGDYRTEMGIETRMFPYGESPFPNRVCFHLGINIYTCPTGDFSYHVSQLVKTGSEYAAWLSARHLPARDAWMGTHYQLFPKLIYGAAAVTHASQALEDAYQSIWYKLLPSLRVNRNITKEYRMLPLRFQGLALPNPNIESLSRKYTPYKQIGTRAVR